MRAINNDFVLDARGIDEASEQVRAFLEAGKVDRRSAMSARITFESALIRLSERFGDEAPASLTVDNWLGRPHLRVRVRGERFDPRELGAEPEWERVLRESTGLAPVYAYRGGYNIVSLTCPRPPMSSFMVTTIAVITGAVLARAGLFLPEATRQSLLDSVVNPIFDTFVGMLAGVAGPMVFLSVAWGICGIGDTAALGRSGKALVGRFLGVDAFATVFALLACAPIIRIPSGVVSLEGQSTGMMQMLLDLLPTNMVKPFVEGNTLQIIVLAIAIGVVSLVLGDATEGVRRALRELNVLVRFLMEQICRLMPGFIVVMAISQTWSGNLGALLSCWLPVILICTGIVIIYVIRLVAVAMKSGLSVRHLLEVSLPALVLSFMTASSSATFGTTMTICEDELGVDEDQASFGIPLGTVLCKPSQCVVLVVVMLYSAKTYGLEVNTLWYMRLALSCFLYSIAVPPIPGGMLACYGVLLASLGIPTQALAIVTALDLLLDNPCTAGDVGGLILEVLDATRSIGAVNPKKAAE